jgi:epoxyqueuosine reductase QueG|tara:strand:- start:203 stop:907 length:705 start_codon:yes stop_codon:yes gene_type:complete
MAKRTVTDLDNLSMDLTADKIGIVNLNDGEDTSLWNQAQKLLPGAKSVIVLAMELFSEAVNQATSKAVIGDLALRDLYRSNTDMVNGYLNWNGYKMVKSLHAQGFKGLLLPADAGPYDSRLLEGALSYRHAAETAGLGIIGWHGLLITPEYGPRVRLACILTDTIFASSTPLNIENPCFKCGGNCIKICPVKAISKPQVEEAYHLDKYFCCSYYTASGMCAECLKACPVGQDSP